MPRQPFTTETARAAGKKSAEARAGQERKEAPLPSWETMEEKAIRVLKAQMNHKDPNVKQRAAAKVMEIRKEQERRARDEGVTKIVWETVGLTRPVEDPGPPPVLELGNGNGDNGGL